MDGEKDENQYESATKWRKMLLPHEQDLFARGELKNVTHPKASSIWLESPSIVPQEGQTVVYRPMADPEVKYLVENNQLPATQPYQAIIEGENGRVYSEKYLNGKKWVNTNPTSVVEFLTPIDLIETLKKMQMKAEDGAISMGLGHKAGKGLPLFNESLRNGETTFRIVRIKRNKEKVKR